jgi:prepilin-type N-terminal cleavage/methylation domain-containing protein
MNKQRGFTLIELLVVIAIVSILAGALLMAINPQSMVQKGRDAKRLQDIDTLVKAINLGLADGEITLNATTGCDNCNSANGSVALDGNGYVKFTIPSGKNGLLKFIQVLPVDPVNSGNNVYTFGSDGTNFEVEAVLEHMDNKAKMSTDGGNNSGAYEMGTSLTIL